jgi:site-specific recombinase XerC
LARWPALLASAEAVTWLALQGDLGRSPETVQAYARGVSDYVGFYAREGIEVAGASWADVALDVRDLRERPGCRGANVASIDSGAGLANATIQLRVSVVRLLYDFLVEEGVRNRNPVARGYRAGDGRGRRRGLVPRFQGLRWIPTDEQWRVELDVPHRNGSSNADH